MINKNIAHYRILDKLGEGGMGVIYKAQDTKLDRLVALKFLPAQISLREEDKKRFIHEAKAAAALDHNNICSVFDFGETDDGQLYMVMPCYEGRNLKDKIAERPLPLEHAIDITIQIAEGLNKAHKKNIVHRDIKSANILITNEGVVKILDFGVAKLKGRTQLTKEDSTLGTIEYMSPEQAEGSKVDHRSDIWSLGIVLYEMITGKLPFTGDYEQAVVYSIMNEEPEPVTGLRTGIPVELEQIINKMLAKDPTERYQHSDDLIADFKRVSKQITKQEKDRPPSIAKEKRAGRYLKTIILPASIVIIGLIIYFLIQHVFLTRPAKCLNSIAVLPLENLSGDAEQEYFADGVTDALIGELAHIRSLKVISRTSIMQYKKVRKPLREIGKELNVNSIVEGTVMHSGDRVLIRVQLIEAATDHHLWSNDFESEMKDILILQQEITRRIAREIRVILTPREKSLLSSAEEVDPLVNELFLRAQQSYTEISTKGLQQTKQYLEEAIKISPTFAKPYALLAEYYMQMHFFAGLPTKEVFPISRSLAEKAIQLDENLSLAHKELALALFWYDWNWQEAEKEFKKAIELQPGSSDAHHYYGCILAYLGRFDEAISEMKKSIELNPLDVYSQSNFVDVLITARRFDEAIEQGQRVVRLAPEFPLALLRLGAAYSAKGLYQKAIPLLEKALKLSGGGVVFKTSLGRAYAKSGQKEKAFRIINEFLKPKEKENFPSVYIAVIYASLGEQEKALKQLEIAFVERDMDIISLKEYFWWDPLRDNPHFQDILKRINFPD